MSAWPEFLGFASYYRRPGFNCESLIKVNCNFNLRAQLLERNYHVVVNAWFSVYYRIYPYELSVESLKIALSAE